jgi:hypothetical protein
VRSQAEPGHEVIFGIPVKSSTRSEYGICGAKWHAIRWNGEKNEYNMTSLQPNPRAEIRGTGDPTSCMAAHGAQIRSPDRGTFKP